jgi:high-affinity iron transporter
MLLCLAVVPGLAQGQAVSPDQERLVRRIAATAGLAAEEYRLGIEDGRVISAAEVEEARLFLAEADRAAGSLPADVAADTRVRLAAVLALVNRAAPADSVAAVVDGLIAGLSQRFGIDAHEVPGETPSLNRGATLYQTACARCHGALGRGDGREAAALNPLPSNLADAVALRDASPLDFYLKTTVGVAGTGMPAFEQQLSPADRWAVALYATTLRLPAASGRVPPALTAFATTGRMSDAEVLGAMGPGASLADVAMVRSSLGVPTRPGRAAHEVLGVVRRRIDSVEVLVRASQPEEARQMAFDAYLAFEGVERDVRVKSPALATELEALFARLRDRAADGRVAEVGQLRRDLEVGLERAERAVSDRLAPLNLFVQSFLLLLREGLEAILVIGALIAFLVKTGSASRRRDIHIGAGVALGASLLTALALETIFFLSPARQEVLEGITMAAAAVMLFYVSYWLLSRIEVAKWNRFVKAKVRDALGSGSALALAAVAFLAVYREGFETVLFYKALMLSAGTGGLLPVLAGMALGAVVLAVVYLAINRFGVRLPLKPFFAVTSFFLYYMAFVFAGKAVAELQEGGLVGTTVVEGAPRIPMMGVYPTVESLAAQGLLLLLALVAMAWLFVVEPARARAAARKAPPPAAGGVERDVLRSLDRIETDLTEVRTEVERLRDRIRQSTPR